jgi:hypothetical protein
MLESGVGAQHQSTTCSTEFYAFVASPLIEFNDGKHSNPAGPPYLLRRRLLDKTDLRCAIDVAQIVCLLRL